MSVCVIVPCADFFQEIKEINREIKQFCPTCPTINLLSTCFEAQVDMCAQDMRVVLDYGNTREIDVRVNHLEQLEVCQAQAVDGCRACVGTVKGTNIEITPEFVKVPHGCMFATRADLVTLCAGVPAHLCQVPHPFHQS